MAQHDYVIDNAPGAPVRIDINAVLQAIVTMNSGPVEPANMFPGMFWLDTSVTPDGQLRQRNQANSAWTTVQAGVIIQFPTADMSILSRTTPDNRIVFNDRVDGTGNDLFAVTDAGSFIHKSLDATGVGNVYMVDSAGVTRASISNDKTANTVVIRVYNAAGTLQQTLNIAASGMSIGSGAGAGTVFTTGNIATSGGGTGATVFTVGTTIMCIHTASNTVARNQGVTPRIDAGSVQTWTFDVTGNPTALAGVWEARGSNAVGGGVKLAQRVG